MAAAASVAAAAAMLMLTLPEEIQVKILLKLPVKSILSCKCVCKPWFNLICSPTFISDHLNLSIQNKKNHKLMFTDKEWITGKPLIYSIDYAAISSTPDLSCEYIGNQAVLMEYYPFEYKQGMEVRILGACNGLICFGILIDSISKSSICIWNPTTREYKEIQHSGFHVNPNHHSRDGFCYDSNTRQYKERQNCSFDRNTKQTSCAGFGYDSKTGDYKIVRIWKSGTSDYCEVEIYTSGLQFSKSIHTIPYTFPTRVAFRGVFLNGALHWICNTSEQDISNYILSFDINNEKLVDVPLPEKTIFHPDESNTKLGVLGDCLCLVLVDRKLVQAEVWMMHEYGVRESWTKLFITTQDPITSYALWMPVLSLEDGEILMYTVDGFVLCDPKNERVGKKSSFFESNSVASRDHTMRMAHPESYVESLVSLNSGTYVKKPNGQKSRNVEYRCSVRCAGYGTGCQECDYYNYPRVRPIQRARRGGGSGGYGRRGRGSSSGSDGGDPDVNGGGIDGGDADGNGRN